jgi:hypothetical protein
MSNQQPQSSLYDRLGGVYSIAVVVDDLIDRVMTDPRLNANPAVDEAHHGCHPLALNISLPKWSAGRAAARRSIRDGPWPTPIGTSISHRRNGKPYG